MSGEDLGLWNAWYLADPDATVCLANSCNLTQTLGDLSFGDEQQNAIATNRGRDSIAKRQ